MCQVQDLRLLHQHEEQDMNHLMYGFERITRSILNQGSPTHHYLELECYQYTVPLEVFNRTRQEDDRKMHKHVSLSVAISYPEIHKQQSFKISNRQLWSYKEARKRPCLLQVSKLEGFTADVHKRKFETYWSKIIH